MDVMVRPSAGEPAWILTDLLGRRMGRVVESAPGEFRIEPDGQAIETMVGMKRGTFPSLDDALAEIEKHTRGVCRRSPEA